MIFERFYDESLSQASFLLGCPASGEAIVIDPTWNLEQYITFAEANALRITHVTETHIHADFASGARELSRRTGAQLFLTDEGDADWKYAFIAEGTPLHDGDVIQVGGIRLKAIHTPGHTPEHLTFAQLNGEDQVVALFTGDFVFAGDLGRPDLLETAAGHHGVMEASARRLFHSMSRLADLPDDVLVWPGHGAGSACGKSLDGMPVTTLGAERKKNWGFQVTEEEAFVQFALVDQVEPPAYFAEMKRLNKLGLLREDLQFGPVRVGAGELRAGIEAGRQIVDVRKLSWSMHDHLIGSILIPLGSGFTNWAGSLLSYDVDTLVLAASDVDAQTAILKLRMIGFTKVGAYALASGLPRGSTSKFPTVGADEVPDGTLLVDVRSAVERKSGAVPGSLHQPLYRLSVATSLPEEECAVHCASGMRAVPAASLLRSRGVPAVAVNASFKDIEQAAASKSS